MSNARVLSKIGRVAFHAFGTSTQSWSAGSQTTQILALGSQVTLPGKVSGYNTSTNQFTVPTDGVYLFTVRITQTGTSTGPVAVLYINGTANSEMLINYSVAYLGSSSSVALYCTAGQIIDMRITNYNSVAVTLDTTRCSFTGVLIG